MADAEARADAAMADAGKVGEAAGQVELVTTTQAEPGMEAAGQAVADASAKRARNAAFADWVHSLAPADARKEVLKKADLFGNCEHSLAGAADGRCPRQRFLWWGQVSWDGFQGPRRLQPEAGAF